MQKLTLNKASLILYSGFMLVGIAALAFLQRFNPSIVDFFPDCLFHSLTGFDCPGCGVTRALHALLNGDILQALHYNLLACLFLPFLLYVGLASALSQCFNLQLPLFNPGSWVYKAIFAFIVLFWLLRNVPIHPFTYLAA